LEETKRLTGGLSKTNGRILDELKLKLTERDVWITRKKIDEILRSEKEIQEAIKPIELGMTISQVEDIMGSPTEMMSDGSEKQNQLWIYRYENGTKVYLTFTNYKLFRIVILITFTNNNIMNTVSYIFNTVTYTACRCIYLFF
jgi:outer membrane protein assembly factor BamE (lipoprotein component of BamABCDE complex)